MNFNFYRFFGVLLFEFYGSQYFGIIVFVIYLFFCGYVCIIGFEDFDFINFKIGFFEDDGDFDIKIM